MPDLFSKKIRAYLRGRKRENFFNPKKLPDDSEEYVVEGLCNGISLLLLEKIFYDCINKYYRAKTTTSIDSLLTIALEKFFSEIEEINATDDALLDSSDFQIKSTHRKLPAYQQANKKLNDALDSGQIHIPDEIKIKFQNQFESTHADKHEGDFFLTLVELARKQNLLIPEETDLLRKEHVPDIPLFEKFITQVFYCKLITRV